MPIFVRILFILGIAVFLGVPNSIAETIDLLDRYPTSITGEDTSRGREWHFLEKDIYSLSQFQIAVGEHFQIHAESSILGIGHCDEGAVWAVILPVSPGTLSRETVSATETVSSIWMRFHPTVLSKLFPPETVSRQDSPHSYYRIQQIAQWKFPASWHTGVLALIPPESAYTIDIDTPNHQRLFFSVDLSNASVKYISAFTKTVPSRDITRQEAESSFDQLWNEFDREYAMFGIRPEVDWNQLKDMYRQKALQSQTAYEFARICADMLAPLRDLHIWIRLGEENIPVFSRPRPSNANPKAAVSLLGGLQKAGENVSWKVTEDKIGYIAIQSLLEESIPSQVDTILESMIDTRGLILDVRLNGGGSEPLGMEIARRFLDKEAIYSYSQYRNGPQHSDLTEKIPRRVQPGGPWRYDRPVTVLIGQKCLSSNESFIAMLDQCPQVTLMGDHTGGSSGNPKMVDLPIGMQVSLPRWLDLLADEKPLDERGIQPDIYFETNPEMSIDHDPLLEEALRRMKQNPLPENPISIPLQETPTPMPDQSEEKPTVIPKPQNKPKPPYVIMLDPVFSATEVNPQMEILVTFDKPMNPNKMALYWGSGGFREIGKIEYYKDIYQFVIPARLEPGITHKISVPPGGFESEEGADSAKIEWSFETAPLEGDDMSPRPHCISIEPATHTPVSRVTLLRLQFDQPMAPDSVSIRNHPPKEGPQGAWCPQVQYDEDKQTITVPLLFPPNWEGTLLIGDAQSRAGKRANPLQLTYKTNDRLYDKIQMESFQKAKDSKELRSLLISMKKARSEMHSFLETVYRIAYGVPQNLGFTYFRTQTARFQIQGATLMKADISQCMDIPFFIGSTGRRYWCYSKESGNEYLRGILPEEVKQLNIALADPLHITTSDVERILQENQILYLGTQTENDRNAHVFQVWRIISGKDEDELCIDEWRIDAETFLPMQLQQNSSNGTRVRFQFQFEKINEEFPLSDFAPASVTRIPMALEDPLEGEFDTRFIYIQDGSDAGFRVEWGKSGKDSYSSIGLN